MENEVKLNLFQKLAKIRHELEIGKSGKNAYAGYNYYRIDDIYSAAKKLFAKHNIFTFGSLLFIPEINKYRAFLNVVDGDEPEKTITTSIDSALNEMKGSTPCQMVGANNTYQMKYLYMNLLMVDDGAEDPDSKKPDNHDNKPKNTNDYKTPPGEERKLLLDNESYLRDCSSVKELQDVWSVMPANIQNKLFSLKEELKVKLKGETV